MPVTAQDVGNLKERTGCGLMDCKRALEETGGDVEEAIKYLREKGLAKAAKKSGRIAAEGLVAVRIDGEKKVGVIVEVNCETDFAAKSERFVAFVNLIVQTLIDNDIPDDDIETLGETIDSGTSEKIKDILIEKIATISENIKIRRFRRMIGELYSYVHDGGGSIIGSLVRIEFDYGGEDADKVAGSCAKDLLLQITASSPQFVNISDVSPEVLTSEKEVQLEIVKKENETKPKPQNVLEKIVEGRMRKFAEEICLLNQPFVKNPDITVSKYIESLNKGIKVIDFVRFEKGEGIQKKEENFAGEVASMINS